MNWAILGHSVSAQPIDHISLMFKGPVWRQFKVEIVFVVQPFSDVADLLFSEFDNEQYFPSGTGIQSVN